MANKTLFSNRPASRAKSADTVNAAGGRAYKLEDAEALCQYVVTSTFSDSYYVSGKKQLEDVKRICDNVSPEIIAKAAVYGHETGGMKDAPAYLLAVLAAKGEIALLTKAFPRVIKSPKMLLNFVQIIRSGVTGRRSFGSAVKRLITEWITSRRGNRLFLASMGYKDPCLVDVIKMVHPRPLNEEQNALFAYLIGKDYDTDALPPLTKEFLAFKADNRNPLPDMDYRSLTNCDLTKDHWLEIAGNMPWNTLRMNLNMLERNGVFANANATQKVATKIADPQQVKQWNAFPYQLLTTFQNVQDVPQKIKLALQDAMEVATENVPILGDRVAVAVDVSGSMCSPVTGARRGGHQTVTQCIDVGALIGASIARTNPESILVSFGSRSRIVPDFNPRDSVMSNSEKLRQESSWTGHGTNAQAAMEVINKQKKPYDFVIFVGDSQSWADRYMSSTATSGMFGSPSGLYGAWVEFKRRNKKAKLVEIVLGPYVDTLVPTSDKDVMNIGGFSDAIFDVLGEFAHRGGNVRFLDVVEKVEL